MPIKKDEAGKRWVDMDLIVPGTPEQVRQAMATGPGYTAWFTPATIDGRVGGTIRFDMGANGESKGEVTVWEPPLRFGYVERDWAERAPPLAPEITVTAKSGAAASCAWSIRCSHRRTIGTTRWKASRVGWPGFFEILHLWIGTLMIEDEADGLAISRDRREAAQKSNSVAA
jgi:hypothetical protein